MELVPILSTIILVGTIATFILAVAAYVLYKIRERRAHEEGGLQVQPAQEPHVLVAPQQPQMIQQPQYQQPQYQQQPQTNVYVGSQQEQAGATRSAVPSGSAPTQTPQARPPQVAQPSQQNSLFWEYTDEGFVPVRPDDVQEREEDTRRGSESSDEGYAWL